MNLGEILSGDRRYFPLPVAYANDRSPIIPQQLGPRPVPLAAASGMGAAIFEETTLTDAVAQPLTVLGIPIAGLAVIVGGAFLYGFLSEKAKGAGRRRKKV